MFPESTPLAAMILNNLESLFNDISINFYSEGEGDFSFSTPILEFGFEYKDKDDSEIKASTLNVAVEVRFQPIETGLKVSHRAFVYKPDTKTFVEPTGFVKSKKYDYKDITSLILDDYDFSDIQLIGDKRLTAETETYLSNGLKLKGASENIYAISEALAQEVKSRLLSKGASIDEVDTVEEREEYLLMEPNFDTPHIYILR